MSRERKRDREHSSSLRPEVLEEIRRPDNYHRLRSSSSRYRRESSSRSLKDAVERKRSSTASSSDLRNSGPVPIPLSIALSEREREKREKFGGRKESGGSRKDMRGAESLPPALKEDLEIFKRELTKHLRKEVLRLRDEMLEDLRREFAALRQTA